MQPDIITVQDTKLTSFKTPNNIPIRTDKGDNLGRDPITLTNIPAKINTCSREPQMAEPTPTKE